MDLEWSNSNYSSSHKSFKIIIILFKIWK